MEKIILNEDQKKLLDTIDTFEKSSEFSKIIFTGSAGTGKTTTIIEAIKKIKDKNLKLIILTPTHQSGIVIRNMLVKNNINQEVQTIHSYFDITPEITDKGERKFIPKVKDINIIEDVFIIDEVSMINKEILKILNDKLKLKHVIYVGDKYQLPPVGEPSSPVFDLDYEKISLEKIMRMENNLESFEKIRNLIKRFEIEKYKAPLEDIYNILKVFKIYNEPDFPKFFNKYTEEKFKNEKYVKIGSFTNNFVEYYNIHFRRFDDEVKDKTKIFSEGDKIILNNPYNYLLFESDKLNDYSFFAAPNILKNGEEIKIKEAKNIILEINGYEIKIILDKLKSKGRNLDNYLILKNKTEKVKNSIISSIELDVTLIKTESGSLFLTTDNNDTKNFIKEIFDLAKDYTYIESNKNKRKQFWRFIYSLSDKIIMVNYAYASTIHKLQGQTLDEIFIDLRDFMHLYNNDYNLFLRLLYVGITRTSNDVFILK